MKTTAIDLVKEEREKQIHKHGYTTARDRHHPSKAVLYGALAYLNSAIYSAHASLEPLFPLLPVYSLKVTPFARNAVFFLSNTLG